MSAIAAFIDILREIWNDRELRCIFFAAIISFVFSALLKAPASAYIAIALGLLAGVLLSEFSGKESVRVKLPERKSQKLEVELRPEEAGGEVATLPPPTLPQPKVEPLIKDEEIPMFPTSTEDTLREEINDLRERLKKQEERSTELLNLLSKLITKLDEKEGRKKPSRSEMNLVPIAKKYGIDAVTLDTIVGLLEGFEIPQELTMSWLEEQVGKKDAACIQKYIRALRALQFKITKKGKNYILEGK